MMYDAFAVDQSVLSGQAEQPIHDPFFPSFDASRSGPNLLVILISSNGLRMTNIT